jgi:hypothetical protein
MTERSIVLSAADVRAVIDKSPLYFTGFDLPESAPILRGFFYWRVNWVDLMDKTGETLWESKVEIPLRTLKQASSPRAVIVSALRKALAEDVVPAMEKIRADADRGFAIGSQMEIKSMKFAPYDPNSTDDGWNVEKLAEREVRKFRI